MSYRFAGRLRACSQAVTQAVSKPVWLIPLLCVQWKTLDDGQKNCLKYVEFYSKNKLEILVHLLGFIIRIRLHSLGAIKLQEKLCERWIRKKVEVKVHGPKYRSELQYRQQLQRIWFHAVIRLRNRSSYKWLYRRLSVLHLFHDGFSAVNMA